MGPTAGARESQCGSVAGNAVSRSADAGGLRITRTQGHEAFRREDGIRDGG